MIAPASASGGSASPLYNMGLVGEHQKLNLQTIPRHVQVSPFIPLAGVLLDKLRLSAYVSHKCEQLGDLLPELHSYRVVKGRRRGNFQPLQFRGWTKPPKSDGGVYVQLEQCPSLPSGQNMLTVEFNPQKLSSMDWDQLVTYLGRLGLVDIGSMYVDRYDVAFDYLVQRRYLCLDDRTRKLDMFGVGPTGPETERTGFRRHSDLKAQLYDKSEERRSAGSEDKRGDVVRFELQVLNPDPSDYPSPLFGHRPGDRLVLRDLEYVTYPGGSITVRACGFSPLRVANHVYGSLSAYARGLGLRAALGYARRVFGLTSKQRDQWLYVMLPELDTSPRSMFSTRWPIAVREVFREFNCRAELQANAV